MENASKALIIAGAILITLIIIGLGVAILGSTEGATDTTTFDAMQVSTFNNKFKPYEGTIAGTKLDALMDILLANARAEGNKNKVKIPEIDITMDGISVDNTAKPGESNFSTDDYIALIKNIKNNIKSAHRYEVTLHTSNTNDLVNKITIK
ncbi:MAG: hypothetical protein J6J60_04865 [Clostridia bacterium]|nr:hypothetical protein [Clostridia bacterium]